MGLPLLSVATRSFPGRLPRRRKGNNYRVAGIQRVCKEKQARENQPIQSARTIIPIGILSQLVPGHGNGVSLTPSLAETRGGPI